MAFWSWLKGLMGGKAQPRDELAKKLQMDLPDWLKGHEGDVLELLKTVEKQEREQGTPLNRKRLGEEKVGGPVMEAFEAVVDTVDGKRWPDFQRAPVGYYFNRMIAKWVPELIDKTLDDKQLASLNPAEAKILVLLLLRDLFRHSSSLLRPNTPDTRWVDALFAEVSGSLGLPAERILDNGELYELEDMGSCDWARKLAAPFGFMPQKLFACHAAIVTGAREEFTTGK